MEILEYFLIFFLFTTFSFSLLNKLFDKSKLPVYPFYLLIFLLINFFKLDFFNNQFLKPNFDLVYDIFLPIILFESAININIHRFRIQFKTISFLATIALIFNAVIVALMLMIFFKIEFIYGLIFGTLISATDPIGVLAIFNNLKIPHRLKLLIEGESMLNDATIIIFFELLLFLFIDNIKHQSIALVVSQLFVTKIILSVFCGLVLGFVLILITKIFKSNHLI